MSAIAGHKAEVKLGDGGSPVEQFTVIAGLQLAEVEIRHRGIELTEVTQGAMAGLRAGQGRAQLRLVLEGLADDGAVHAALQSHALAGDTPNLQVTTDNGEEYQGAFRLERYQRRAERGAVQRVQMVWLSAGAVSYS